MKVMLPCDSPASSYRHTSTSGWQACEAAHSRHKETIARAHPLTKGPAPIGRPTGGRAYTTLPSLRRPATYTALLPLRSMAVEFDE